MRATVHPRFTSVSDIARCGRRGILSTCVHRRIDRDRFVPAANCNCNSEKQSTLSTVLTSVVKTRSTLVHRDVISNARTVAVTLFTVLQPNSALLTTANTPCSALRRIVNRGVSDTNSLGRCNINCTRIPVATVNAPSLPTVRTTLHTGSAVGIMRVRHSEKCSPQPSLSVTIVGRVVGTIHRMHPRMAMFMSGYCNRFIRGLRPARIKTSLVTNSLVGGPNNKVTRGNNCLYNAGTYVRRYTCHVAAPKLNHRINTSLNRGQSLCVNLFRTPRIMKRTLGATMCTTNLFRTLKCSISPSAKRGQTSVVRAILLHDPRTLVTFYRKVRGNTPISTCIMPRP